MWSEKWLQKCSLRLAAWAGAPWWSVVPRAAAVVVVDLRLRLRLLTLTPRKLSLRLQLFNRLTTTTTTTTTKTTPLFQSFKQTTLIFDTQRRKQYQYSVLNFFFNKVTITKVSITFRYDMINKTWWQSKTNIQRIVEAAKLLKCPTHFKNFGLHKQISGD